MKNKAIYLGLVTVGLALASNSRLQAQDKATAATPETVPTRADTAKAESGNGESNLPPGELRLNFRGAPLETVLNYLSEAAGFIIVLETEVKGKIDVWSNQPVSQEEALEILNSALNKNGYAALRNGRTLTIVGKEAARRREIPVKTGNDPVRIPRSDGMVTQIIPIRYINAAQLTENLKPLLPSEANLTANEAGNSLIMTDTETSVRHITEIIRALDNSATGANSIRVFQLQYADSKEVASVLKDLFPSTDTSANNRNGGRGGGGGFPGFPGGFGGGGGGGGTPATPTRTSAAKVIAVADEHSNSVVVNAPEDVMPSIEEIIRNVDTNIQDVTELRVFRLKYADPSEMATILSGLFPDDTKTTDNSRGQFRFGGGPFGGGAMGGGTTSDTSSMSKKKTRVLAVADPRTSSVIVSAAHALMGQIQAMVEQLDNNPARKQKVFVYDLQNADPVQVQDVLRNLFENSQNQNRNRTTTTQTSALSTRSANSQNSTTSGSRTGGSALGTGSGNGGGGGGIGRGN